MFVATFKYDLFQRVDVLCASESPDKLRPAQRFHRAGGNVIGNQN